ncbi:MerR family transcriptional regulator [Brachybacterium sp. AOP43-C2-M15]|uniref:MerR family transcriptional regulator n=1 Tax=Brachybacterium sp. AOP43-C2-M15 TaxID=3457661 RepID=UPI00403436F5
MRIAELADLAGVSVRTLRYYHQTGALPEPPRRANGYRDYSADHLVTVLRIRQLTGSGLSLAAAGELAADPAPTADDEVLEAADRALAAQIAVLTERRARLARAREGGHVGLSREAAALSLAATDLSPAILLAHLYRDHEPFHRLVEALHDPERRGALTALQQRFDAIDADTPEAELAEITAQVQDLFAGISEELPPLTPTQMRLLLELSERDLTAPQRDFLRRQG